MGLPPDLHLGVVAIEKGAFESRSTKVANFTINLVVCEQMIEVKFNCLCNIAIL